ncbi:MAG: protein translocase subunit SecF [Gammaproteobacteria bacterium]|jgi:preprotein translocase subunit SecF|nr:protein translocase subunit SecF [Gammaproteobacteria bacterium]|tara:strand:+ start:3815 stop:4708 length:894 start_codon:yes stop_codon:yes gene_type:complete
MGARRIALIFSAVAIVFSLGSLITRGLNFGLDFSGGYLLEMSYSSEVDLADIRSALAEEGFENPLVQNFGTVSDVLVRLMPQDVAGDTETRDRVVATLSAQDPSAELQRFEFVGPQVGDELTEDGALAMLIALILIFIYVMLRFRWKFAVGTISALVHDVIVVFGFFSIFGVAFDLTIVAALLATIGYSLNDTIVVFDRIRENFRVMRRGTSKEIINASINQMLGRTMITSLTTLLVLLCLFFLGGEAISGFALALVVGVIIGTYSSIYIASASALALNVSTTDLIPQKREEIDDMP